MADERTKSPTKSSTSEIKNLKGKEEQAHDSHYDDEEDHYAYALQIVDSLAFPMAMQTAIELNLLGIIAQAGSGQQLSAAAITARLPGCRNPDAVSMLDRLLHLLATYSVVTCSTVKGGDQDGGIERKYGLAPVAKHFLPNNEDGVSLAPTMLLSQDKVFVDSW